MTVTLDTSTWDRDEIHLIQSALVGMLYEAGHHAAAESVACEGGVCQVAFEGEFPFTGEQVRTRIHQDDAKRDISALDDA